MVPATTSIKSTEQCKITYRLTSLFKQEVIESDRLSGTGPLNTSGYSIQHAYERKCMKSNKKDDIPSKDNISVASYNPTRYPSNNKRDREDSLRKH